jgi:hypothetical protein
MDGSSFAPVGQDEEQLLRVFRAYGPDGRAISIDSLKVLVPFGMQRERLQTALGNLVSRRLVLGIEEGLRPRGATAFRLVVKASPVKGRLVSADEAD